MKVICFEFIKKKKLEFKMEKGKIIRTHKEREREKFEKLK